MLNRDNFTGPWAGLPVAWTDADEFDEERYRQCVIACCDAGVPGVYTGGTTGEFYAMEWDEFCAVAKATVDECHSRNVPAMIGCTATYTRGVLKRVRFASDIGADAVQIALPFWMEIEDPDVVPFFSQIENELNGMVLSVYETLRAKKALTIDQHRGIKGAVPNYLMVKSNDGTLGHSPQGCEQLSEFVNVFTGESTWNSLGPHGVRGGCSSMIYWNPKVTLRFWTAVSNRDWTTVAEQHEKIGALFDFVVSNFAPKGYTDTAFDRLGGLASGFLPTSHHSRAPYRSTTEQDVAELRQWYESNFPEMLWAD